MTNEISEKEAYLNRVKAAAERAMMRSVCPCCGYENFTGSVHSAAGSFVKLSDGSRKMCNGKQVFRTRKTGNGES